MEGSGMDIQETKITLWIRFSMIMMVCMEVQQPDQRMTVGELILIFDFQRQAHGGTMVASASDLGGLRLVVQLPLRNEEMPDWAEKTGL